MKDDHVSHITGTTPNASTDWRDDGAWYRLELHDHAALLVRRDGEAWHLVQEAKMNRLGFYDLSRVRQDFRDHVKWLHQLVREDRAAEAEGRPNRFAMTDRDEWRMERHFEKARSLRGSARQSGGAGSRA